MQAVIVTRPWTALGGNAGPARQRAEVTPAAVGPTFGYEPARQRYLSEVGGSIGVVANIRAARFAGREQVSTNHSAVNRRPQIAIVLVALAVLTLAAYGHVANRATGGQFACVACFGLILSASVGDSRIGSSQ